MEIKNGVCYYRNAFGQNSWYNLSLLCAFTSDGTMVGCPRRIFRAINENKWSEVVTNLTILPSFTIFLAVRCNATFGHCHVVCLSSVCSFVMRVYCDKTAAVRIMQFALKCSPMPYLFVCQVWWQNSKGALRSGAQSRVEWFSTSRCCISETMRDRT